jgi:hypothetical protein
VPDLDQQVVGGPARWPPLIEERCGCGAVFEATQNDDAIRDLRAMWRKEHRDCPPACDHDGQLVEVAELREVRCDGCGEMAPTAEKHLGAAADA